MPSDQNLYAGYDDAPVDPYEKPAKGPSRRMRLLTGGIAFLALAGFTYVVWYAYDLGIRAGTESVAPLIRADGRPTKIRPEQPGGMEIPHQDKEVYDTITNDEEATRVEVIMPPTEAPLPRPVEAATETALELGEASPVTTPVPPPPSSIAELLQAIEEAAPPPAPDAPEPLLPPVSPAGTTVTPAAPPLPQPMPAPEPLPEVAIVPEADAALIEDAVVDVATVTDLSTRWRVQIAALRTEAKARAEWERFKGAHPDLLDRLILEIQRVDLGPEKGVFYRLRAGPLANRTAAASLCVQLKVRDLGCLVVRPE